MLQDFIESNNLQATLLPYPAKGRLVKCMLFTTGHEDVLTVSFASDKVSEEKVKAALKVSSIKQLDRIAAEEVSGYLGEFLPPISIYGVKVLVDKKVIEAEKVRCLVSEEKTLEIAPKEIIEANDNSLIADITL